MRVLVQKLSKISYYDHIPLVPISLRLRHLPAVMAVTDQKY